MPIIKRTPQARQDAAEIWAYIARNNAAAATRTIKEIEARLNLLAKYPSSGRAVPFISPQVRRLPINRYGVYYIKIENGIEVVRILHERRELKGLF